jgi:hypothetical protein
MCLGQRTHGGYAFVSFFLALAGCAASGHLKGDSCRVNAAQSFVGQMADQATGSRLLQATHTREIRWAGPDIIVTASYKFGRLTVIYDRDMKIAAVSCG